MDGPWSKRPAWQYDCLSGQQVSTPKTGGILARRAASTPTARSGVSRSVELTEPSYYPQPVRGPKWGPHRWHGSFAPRQTIGTPFYLSVRWTSGEELAWVKVRTEDDIGSVRHALVKAVGHGKLRLLYRDQLLEDSMQICDIGLEKGSIIYAFEQGSTGLRTTLTRQPITHHAVLMETGRLASARRFMPDRESEEEMHVARHGLGKKLVLSIP
mmetsp:Transcript_4340/g.8672  ORF Transcript_4340/g.8672 Transcript_4340/m.8672 type:complete len:213 (-) Transcript_4340:27-665(-)